MNKDSKIYVTGSTGLVGSNLLKRLEREGYTNLIYKDHKDLDLINQQEVVLFFHKEKPEYVFHCAVIVGGIQANIDNPYKFLFNNLMMQNNVIDVAIKNEVKKILFLGSSCIYPKDYKQPLKEEYLLQAPMEETNLGYALAKIAGLKLCKYANKQFNTNFISLMPCNLYGPGNDFDPIKSHVLQALIRKIYEAKINNKKEVIIWGSGKPRREFLYVDDIVDCMLWSMNNIDKIDTFLNVGTGKDDSIIELAEIVAKVIDWKGKFVYDTSKPDGMMRKCLDVSKINKLGWKAKISLEEGIKETIEYYEKYRTL